MNNALLPAVHFDSDRFSSSERFDRWRSSVSSFADVEVIDSAEAFAVRTTAWHLGRMIVSAGEYHGEHSFTWCANRVPHDHMDHLRLTLRVTGRTVIESGDQSIEINPGEILIEDVARPCRAFVSGGYRIMVFIPLDAFEKVSNLGKDLHGVVVQGECAAMLGNYLQSLVRILPTLRLEQARQLADATTLLVAACVMPAHADGKQAAPIEETALLRQICRHIENKLTDPSLSTQSICGEFHLSRATLYRLLSSLGGVKAYIRDQRLQSIHALLSSSCEAPRYLARLADQYQFSSAADFSRAFRAKFGYTPRDVRTRAIDSARGVIVRAGDEPTFSHWLGSTLH